MCLKKLIQQHLLLFLFSALFLFSLTSCVKETDDSTDDDILGNWMKRSDFEGVARTEAVSFIINEKVYVGTGFRQNNERQKDFWEFDQTTGTWLQKADLPGIARNSAVAFTVNNMGYVGTGWDGNNALKDFWQYDPVGNTWTKKTDFGGTARYGAVAFSLNGKGFISTGNDGNHLKDLWEYSPDTDQWIQKASIGGSKRTDAVAFVINGKAYICTGLNNGAYVDDLWEYNYTANTWTQKRRMINISDDDYDDLYSLLRNNASVFVINNKAYLTCGESNGIIATTWEYDPVTDLWVEKTGFEGTSRTGATAFTIANRGYVVCGNNSTYRFDDLREFDPNSEKIGYD